MNNQSIETMRNILNALMTINTRGNDTITMSNCLQAMQQVIEMEMTAASAQPTAEAPSAMPVEPEVVE